MSAATGAGTYVLVLDSGTTSVRSILFDTGGSPIGAAHQPLTQIYPEPGWVEHDAREILAKQLQTVGQVVEATGIDASQIAAVGITNQRESTVVWDRVTGEPVYNAICWQCRRTAPLMQRIAEQGLEPAIRERTGLVCDPYFSASKLSWILDNTQDGRERARAGELLFGTIDSWIVWNLTKGEVHATDPTNASRTMLYDIRMGTWDEWLCGLFDIPMCMLPEVRPSSGDFGMVSSDILGHRPPVTGVAGDQQASLVGHCCFEPGDLKATYGTGAFILMAAGDTPPVSKNGLVTTVAATFDGRLSYALEGSVFNAGTVVQWLRDELCLIETAAETEPLALSVPDTAGVYLVPAFTGLGAPWWDAEARGILCGITRGTNRAHIVRAALESEAYQVNDVVEAMCADFGRPVARVAVDGGGSCNAFTMQFQADLIGRPVVTQRTSETTALGAAFLAGVAAGVWPSVEALADMVGAARRFEPTMSDDERQRLVSGWRRALDRCRG